MIDAMRTLMVKTMIDINNDMTAYNNGLMIEAATGC
jgi:hypothetical protein